ncbi:filamentous hemagglutinin N-terminal domain-containing protein, partial [Salmonella enterica]
MNKIYKLKFDKRRNELVVVSEITAGIGKAKTTGHLADLTALSPFRKLLGTLTPLALLTGLICGLLPAMVLAADLPAGGQIVGGQGSISTSGNQMTIHQQTHNMATNWHSFDVGKNSTVQFVQPDSSSVALNRVTGTGGSQIMGTLKANGQVFILNPNGVLFGKDARVNVAGLVASTKNINAADFMKGQYTLSGEGQPGAQVVNQGSLTTAKGGYIVLAGERVSNSGVIATPSGKTVLAAGKAVTLQLDNGGLTSVSVNGSVVNALVENRGLISATNGQVYLTAKGQDMLLNTVVNNSGTIEAKGLASRGGEIVLDGGESGVVSQSGQLLADSHTGQGGKVILEGQNIYLAGGSLTSATGQTGGGEVYVGGGWQGKDSRIKNASKVVMDKAATVDVSATDAGNGGTAVLWSDDYTNFRGSILAQGGAQSGNGGRVETSSHRNLQVSGTADASARAGHGGEWLLDPTDVTITGTGTDTGVRTTGKGSDLKLDTDTEHLFTPTASGAQILNTSIENQLNNGTAVIVKTSGFDVSGQSGNITVNANITKTGGADAALTLEADGNITVNKNITSTVGRLNISLLAAGSDSGRIQVLNSTLNSNGGNITLGQLNPTTVAEDGSSISNPNALTVKVNNSTLNASATTGSAGDILISARNPNVDLSQTKYNNTVRNGWSLVELSGNAILTGGDITLNSEQSGENAKSLPWYLNHTTVNATGDIFFSAQVTNGKNVPNAEIRDTGNSLTAGGNISLTSVFSGSAGTGSALWFNGSEPSAIQLKAGKNITLTGINPGSGSALNIKNTALTAGEGITLNGSAATGTGLSVTNSTLNASHATITGASTGGRAGFSLTNITLNGALADLVNVTLSSAGSAAGAVNTLDSSIVTDSNLAELIKKRIENMTSVEMGGKAIFDDSEKTDKGWKNDYTSVDTTPNGSWIFNNTSVKAGGDVELKGVGFTNATMDITQGNLSIDNGGSLVLTGSNVSVVNGNVNLRSENGNINLSNGNLTAKNDIAITANNGSVTVMGVNTTDTTNITSQTGNISIKSGEKINLTNVNVSASNDISFAVNSSKSEMTHDWLITIRNTSLKAGKVLNITTSNGSPMNYFSHLYLANSTLSGKTINVNLSGLGHGAEIYYSNTFNGNLSFKADTVAVEETDSWYSFFLGGGSNIVVNGNANISSSINGDAKKGTAILLTGNVSVTGDLVLNGNNGDDGAGIGAAYGGRIISAGGNITIEGKSKGGYGVVIGNGQISSDNVFINGTSTTNTGIYISNDAVLNNAEVKGSATNGIGVQINNNVSLNDVSLKGNTDSGTGVNISGNLTNAGSTTVNGVSSGSGTGVDLSGNVSGGTVNGSSVSGSGVNIAGNLTGASVVGVSDAGTGVQLADNSVVTQASLNGTSTSGDGLAVTGNVKLDDRTAAALKASSVNGTGLKLDDNADVSILNITTVTQEKKDADGNPVLDADGKPVTETLTTQSPVTTPVTLTGTSEYGTGIATEGNVRISGIVLNGSTSADGGTGVSLGGNLTIKDAISGVTAGATGHGTALVMNGASVNTGGYADTGLDFVINASVSGGGTAIKTQGSNHLGDVVLNGTASNGGTAVELGGQVSGADITGTSDNGTAVRVLDGANIDGDMIQGHSDSGTGLNVSGNATLSNTGLIGTTQTG